MPVHHLLERILNEYIVAVGLQTGQPMFQSVNSLGTAAIGPVYLIVGNRAEEQSYQASCTLVRHERQPLITFSHHFANQPADPGNHLA
jgi:hypothetical protein